MSGCENEISGPCTAHETSSFQRRPMDANLLAQVKSSVDLVRVVEGYCGPGRRAGVNIFYPCPFHTEKTGSFCLNTKKQLYRCHGCGVGGDSVKFIQEIEHVPFVEAVKILATMGGVEIKELTEADKRAYAERRRKVEAEQKAFEKWLADVRDIMAGSFREWRILRQRSLDRLLPKRKLPTCTLDTLREEVAMECFFSADARYQPLYAALWLVGCPEQPDRKSTRLNSS